MTCHQPCHPFLLDLTILLRRVGNRLGDSLLADLRFEVIPWVRAFKIIVTWMFGKRCAIHTGLT